MKWLIVLALVASGVTACSSGQEEPTGVIPQAQLDALEKAKGVEDAMKRQAEDLQKRVDEGG